LAMACASFAFVAATRDETCSHALAAAAEAMRGLDRLNADRARMGKPIAGVDLTLHLGEVLYGNVGAMDRLDFTAIGPAVNEVARIETLCASHWATGFSSRPSSPPRPATESSLSRSVRTSSVECASRKKFSLCGFRTMSRRKGRANLLYLDPIAAPYFGLREL
jgi:hypothetical protein